MCAGALAAGFCCARIVRKNGMMCGFVSGAIFSLVLLILSFTVPGNSPGLGAFLKVAMALLSAMIGGVLGVNSKKRKK
jgi:putative membrane protein (TIGR04086 family)